MFANARTNTQFKYWVKLGNKNAVSKGMQSSLALFTSSSSFFNELYVDINKKQRLSTSRAMEQPGQSAVNGTIGLQMITVN